MGDFTVFIVGLKCITTWLHKNCVTTDFIQHIRKVYMGTPAQYTKHNSVTHCEPSLHTWGSCDQGGVKASLHDRGMERKRNFNPLTPYSAMSSRPSCISLNSSQSP